MSVTPDEEDADEADDVEGSEDVYVQTVVFRDETTWLEEVSVCVGGPDIERLKHGILAGFQAGLDRHLHREEFGGEIEVVILGEVTPQSPGLWRAMGEMEEHLKAVIAAGRLKTAS